MPDAPTTAAFRDVELVSVGTWAASTGVTTVTRDDLEAMLAAHADGLVDHAPIKLGHVSPLNDNLGDGAPAYGWVVPKRIAVNKAGLETLYGDLVAMPAQLAEVAPTAYRRRSVEIAWKVTTATGKAYRAALVGVALLGASAPAVKGLADVLALYSKAGATPGVPDFAGLAQGEGLPDGMAAELATVELVDGLEASAPAVAAMAAARLAGATVEQLDLMASAAGARDTADVPPPTSTTTDDDTVTATTEPGDPMSKLTDEQLREKLGLEKDADVDKALGELLKDRGTDPATAGTDPVEPTPATVPAVTAGQPETVQLSAATYGELTALAQRDKERRRDDALDGAIRSGRIAPAERDTYLAAMGPELERLEVTIDLLGALAPKFAVEPVGHSDPANPAQLAEATDKAYDQFEAETFGLDRSAS